MAAELTTKTTDLINRLRGHYRTPITDGLGPAGGEEPDNPHEHVRTFPVPPIHKEAADEIERLRAAILPLVRVAEAIDRRTTNTSMSDSTGLWTEQNNFKENVRLTVGDARQARKVFNGQT